MVDISQAGSSIGIDPDAVLEAEVGVGDSVGLVVVVIVVVSVVVVVVEVVVVVVEVVVVVVEVVVVVVEVELLEGGS